MVATRAMVGDHTVWRAHSLENVTMILEVTRDKDDAKQRYFAGLTSITAFPEFGHEFKHGAKLEMEVGETSGEAATICYCIPMNFKEPDQRQY